MAGSEQESRDGLRSPTTGGTRVRRGRRAGARVLAAAATVVTALAVLTGCTSERPGPEAAAQALASALASGDFSAVAFDEPDAASTAADRRAAAYEALAPHQPQVRVGDVTVDPEDEDAATATLAFTWDLGAAEPWEYTTHARLARGAQDDPDTWRVSWASTLLAPDLSDTEVLGVERVAGRAGGRPGRRWRDPDRDRGRSTGSGSTRPAATQAAQQDGARDLATALGMDPDAFAARVEAAGPKAFVEAIVVRENDPGLRRRRADRLPHRSRPGATPSRSRRPGRSRARCSAWWARRPRRSSRSPTAPWPRATSPGSAGWRGSTTRGCAAPRACVVVATAEGTDARRELFSAEPVAAGRCTPRSTSACRPRPTRCSPTSARRARSSRCGPRPATCSRSPPARAAAGCRRRPWASTRPARRSRWSARSRCCARGPRPTPRCRAPRRSPSTGASSPTSPATRRRAGHRPAADRVRELLQHRLHLPARRRVGAGAGRRRRLAGLGAPTGDLGFPAFLGSVPADSTGTDHAASMIGQGRVLASPLGMATVAASVAAGRTVVPRIVSPTTTSAMRAHVERGPAHRGGGRHAARADARRGDRRRCDVPARRAGRPRSPPRPAPPSSRSTARCATTPG